MRSTTSILVLLGLLLAPGSCSSPRGVGERVYQGFPRFDSIRPEVLASGLFVGAPEPSAKRMVFAHLAADGFDVLYQSEISVVETRDGLTRVHTSSSSVAAPDARTAPSIGVDAIDWAGLVTLMSTGSQSRTDTLTRSDVYRIQELTEVSRVEGRLFPLAVGNRVSFRHTSLLRQVVGQPLTDHGRSEGSRSGRTRYVVAGVREGYSNAHVSVSGEVFTIEEWADGAKVGELLWSNQLGWYVAWQGLDRGRVVARAELRAWE